MRTEEYTVDNSCCFTGHRPDKLKGEEKDIRAWLGGEIRKAAEEGMETFLTGMAAGIDIWAAEEVLALKEEGKTVKLLCAVPFQGVENNRSEKDQKEFRDILKKADDIEYIMPKASRKAFLGRDRWMVDHAARVIAVFNGTPGGTGYTVNYAKSLGRKITILDDSTMKETT